jgi:group I intron endonuclease
MKKYGSVYLITNIKTGQQYVGQTKNNILNRFNDHARDKRSSRYLSSAIIKHGRENFKVEELVAAFSKEDLNYLETYFIETLNTMVPNGYNLSKGEDRKGTISDLTREKMKLAKLGKKVNRSKTWSLESRLRKSREQGGKQIKAINLITREEKIYDFINQAENDGFNNSEIYRVLSGKRKHHRNHSFVYISDANQSGSSENNDSEHAQRLELEATNVE